MDQELFKKGPFKRFDRQQALDYIKQLDNAMRQMLDIVKLTDKGKL